MVTRNPAVLAGCCHIYSRPCGALVAGLLALACLLPAVASAARQHYVIHAPIRQVLEAAEDPRALCHQPGPANDHLVLFMPAPTRTVPVYWHPRADRFIQYPGTTGCVIWKRRNAAAGGS